MRASCEVVVVFLLFFFFQAEDGIRDRDVTGVQTCALPISSWLAPISAAVPDLFRRAYQWFSPRAAGDKSRLRFRRRSVAATIRSSATSPHRSEERRVGKECRSRWLR